MGLELKGWNILYILLIGLRLRVLGSEVKDFTGFREFRV